jgi:Cu-Zn family superoxide dismutase
MRSTRTQRVFAVLVLVLVAAVALLPGAAATAADTNDASSGARANVRSAAGDFLGTVTIQQVSGKLIVGGRLTGLAAGFHGFHIHAVGICDPRFVDPTGAVVPLGSAGPHLNPAGATHGQHAGDLPSLLVAADGTAVSVAQTGAVTFAQIFDADGAAFIIHAAPDNFANIPTRYSAGGVPGPDAATLGTGDSGARFACGVITRG